jgi:DNA-binding XRE family transcriptional regulator
VTGYYLAVRPTRGGFQVTNAADDGQGNVVARMEAAAARNKAIKQQLALGVYATEAEAAEVMEWLMGDGLPPDVDPLADVAADFSSTLARLRESAGLTLQDLGDSAGLSRQRVHQFETGAVKPTWAVVQALATALDVSTEVFRDPES